MKKCIGYLVAMALAVFPISAQAEDVKYDDGSFEESIPLSLTAAPAVQFDVTGTGVYALERVTIYLRQAPEETVEPVDPGAPPAAMASTASTPATYPVTVQVWLETAPGAGTYALDASIDENLPVDENGSELILANYLTEKLFFTGSIRIGIFLQDELSPVHLGVDTNGPESDPAMPFGHSFSYDPSATTWTAVAANYGIRASIVPALTGEGFLSPLNGTIIMKKGGRTLPLKCKLFDGEGAPVSRRDLVTSPLVRLLYAENEGTDPQVVPAGKSNKGQMFRYAGKGKWIYNLKTNKNFPPGAYTVLMETGDAEEYAIYQPCEGKFVIEAPVKKKPHPGKGPK